MNKEEELQAELDRQMKIQRELIDENEKSKDQISHLKNLMYNLSGEKGSLIDRNTKLIDRLNLQDEIISNLITLMTQLRKIDGDVDGE